VVDEAALIKAAIGARQNSYSPYSHFAVGAAIWTEAGSIVTGSNVENGSYPLSLCAERAAIATAVGMGHRHFLAVAIVAGERPVTPCGGCRQVLFEFGDMDVIAVSAQDSRHVARYRLRDLLPHAFDLEELR
jgi:cytidine deaminase